MMNYTVTLILFRVKQCIVTTVFIFLAQHAFSQQVNQTTKPDLETDRPDQTESASIVAARSFQLETGFYFEKATAGNTERIYTAYPTTLLRIGLLKGIEVRAEGTYQNFIVEENAKTNVNGFGPLTIGAKVKFWEESGFRPQTAFMTMITLPVGHDAFTPENPEPNLRLLFKNSLTDQLDLSHNLAYGWEDGNAVKSYSVSLCMALNDRIGAFGEVFGDKIDGEKAIHSADTGITFLVLPNLQLDLAAGTTINSPYPEYFVTTGISVRLPR
ncbi:transporter [Pontibacter fetidus]|uniref:Transporter n=1 Tax=Pontibacter fetidus TaxID=2700082 RepID=A0A6B2H0L3_9BACT|nr:transporter [Pontibacter fetidus]NDK56625.1 transporter [Pontibacter fetidus]